MPQLLHDLRFSLRNLRRTPAFTTLAVATLALGIGGATAIFTAFDAIMLRKMPLADPDRVVALEIRAQSGNALALSVDEIDALRRASGTLNDVAGVTSFGAEAIPLSEGERSIVLNMSRVTPDFFQVLGVRPVLGRLLRPEDGEEGASLVTVISHGAWQREFGGDPDVVGRRLTRMEDRASIEIVGVAPAGLDYPVGADYWLPPRPRDGMRVVARLADGATPEAARAEFLAIATTLDAQRATPRSPVTATVQPLTDVAIGEARPVLVAIAAAVALLLLIACVNVGNLLFMRVTQRSGDVMILRALGATSGGVARLFLIESALLGAAGGALGLAFAMALLRVLPALAPARLPRTEMIGLAGTPVAMAVVVTMAAVLLSGVVPALVAASGNIAAALRADGRSVTGTKRRRKVRKLLLAAQVALAVILLVGAGLLVRTLQRLDSLELGYDTHDVALVELGFNRADRPGPEETFALLDGVMQRMREVPGVTSASLIMSRPYIGATGIFTTRPVLDGQSDADAASNPSFPLEVGGHELFRTLGIPILRGRGLLESDREDAPRVAVVSRSVAERLWPGEDPIGRRIRMVTSDVHWWTVVGVAGDTRFRRLAEPTPTIYLHYGQLRILPGVWTVAVRSDADFAMVVPALRRAVRDFDPRLDVWRTGTLRDHLARGPLARPRMSALLLSGFALAALLLAAIGVYGVMALSVRERTHELGVRTALGASATRLRRDVLGEALGVTLAGTVAGLGIALLATRLLVALLFDVSPADPMTLLAVCATSFVAAALAAWFPARRATRVDPLRALRG